MIKSLSHIEKMLAISLGFTATMLLFRIFYSHTLSYIFFAWNLFLAVIPLLISRKLQMQKSFGWKVILLLSMWMLFLPNAPYVLTDIFHFRERPPVPKWYDLLLVTSASWNGLMLGFISIMQVEKFLSGFLSRIKVMLVIFCAMFFCAYGIYIGRFLRYNSWDILSDPLNLASDSVAHFLHPLEHFRVWEFTLLFAVMLTIIYFTLKHLPRVEQRQLV